MSNKPSVRENTLLDTIQTDYQLTNDAQVSRFLGLQPSVISRIRANQQMTDFMRIRILRLTNWPITKLDQLAPPQLEK